MPTKISWTDESWNPIVGCSHESAGCDNCYAERMAHRLACMGNTNYQDVLTPTHDGATCKWNGKTVFVESALEKPLHWKTARTIFVCSMSDLFHPSIPFEWIDKVFAVMWESYCRTSGHTFQLLTKRPERMAEYYNSKPWTRVHVIIKEMFGRNWGAGRLVWPSNVWLGVTAENQEQADKRIPILLQIPAALRFVSVEPMLGPVDLRQYLGECSGCGYPKKDCVAIDRTQHISCCPDCKHTSLSWVIIGAESGPKRRYCEPEWAYSLKDQCKEAGVPCFVKQLHDVITGKIIKAPAGFPREMPETR